MVLFLDVTVKTLASLITHVTDVAEYLVDSTSVVSELDLMQNQKSEK
jgi:hypothetical protein